MLGVEEIGRVWEEVAHTCEKSHRGHSAFSLMSHRTQFQKSHICPSEQTSHTPMFLSPAASEVRPWTAKGSCHLSRILSRNNPETFRGCQGQEYVWGALLFVGTK